MFDIKQTWQDSILMSTQKIDENKVTTQETDPQPVRAASIPSNRNFNQYNIGEVRCISTPMVLGSDYNFSLNTH
jgi:hypothetical protein